ncbi:MAG TPA: acyl-CoA synthetase [Novosphingobium sp.]|nr:acyl-CoA synthetase [Novosphingobium sp.]
MHPFHHARTHPGKAAVIFSGGTRISYADLDARSNQVAHLLRQHGIGQGDAVAIFLENEPAYFEIMWGCQRTGTYAVPISSRLLADELAYIVGDCGAKLLFASPALEAIARDALKQLGDVKLVVAGPAYETARNAAVTTPVADEAGGTEMVYSSGTTGKPKGIRPALPLGLIDAPTRMATVAQARYAMGEDTVYLSPAPLYHAAPLRWAMTVHRLGGTVVVMEKFDAETVLSLIQTHRVTHAQFVPTHFSRLLALPEEVRARYDTSSLRVVVHAAAPCPREVKEAMMAWWGPILYEYYAGSEGNGVTVASPEDWLSHPGTVGRGIGCEVKICGEDGEPLADPEAEGVVYFAGGLPFEYHNDPEKTAASRNRHGWSTLGDVGRLDKDGFLFLTDRKNFMIISGGVNIYPQEIENAIISHPLVFDAAVVAAPHPDLGEQVTAVVQPLNWNDAGTKLAAELRAYLRERISHVKVPRTIDFMEELPRLPTGKLMKRHLRDAYFGANDGVAAMIVKGDRP